MTPRFTECLPFVLAREGGFVDDPLDRGGATNYGITQRVYDAWRMCRFLPVQSVRDISADERDTIYLENYWQPLRGGEMEPPLDLVLFDTAVQHGPTRAIRMLQDALGVPQDGVFGPGTLVGLNAFRVETLVELVLAVRKEFYARIIARDSTQIRFERGWNNRMAALHTEALKYEAQA